MEVECRCFNAFTAFALLQKKNKMLEEALQLALKAQEKVEKRLLELKEKTEALQTQNDYLGTRIDGNEEDKGALRHRGDATAVNGQLLQKRNLAGQVAVKAELDYIKREDGGRCLDMLDETGRTKPILIELIERLQINEFLYSSQQARNPVPMLVEKISHLLEMLHTTQVQSDMTCSGPTRCCRSDHGAITGLREKNKNLYEKVQMCETWKMRALLKIASNEFEMRGSVKGHKSSIKEGNALYLDGLQYSNKEIGELKKLIQNYMKEESGFVERIPGVTTLVKDPVTGDLRARSGNQANAVRLVILLEDQSPPDPEAPPPDAQKD
eukprot:Skav212488  [mRNA]  locus=scaffold6473:4984:16810:+ [translate_table: standard]